MSWQAIAVESIGTAAATSLTARLFQHLRVGGELLADPERTERSGTSGLSDAVRRDQRPTVHRSASPATLPARMEKSPTISEDQPAPSATALRYQRSGDASLFLTTQQGDTVQLKFKSQASVAFASTAFEAGDTLLSQLRLQSENSSEISLLINGDLSADELRAIASVVDQVSAIAQDFFAGNVADAFAIAERFKMDGAQLANLGVGMHLEEMLTYSQMSPSPALGQPTSSAADSGQQGSDAERLEASASPLTPVLTGIQTSTPAQHGTNGRLPAAHRDALHTHPQAMHQALDVIGGFLKGLMDTLKQSAPGEKTGNTPSIGVALKTKIFQSVLTTAAAAAAQHSTDPTPLPALVGDTLEALSAKHEPPLTTVV